MCSNGLHKFGVIVSVHNWHTVFDCISFYINTSDYFLFLREIFSRGLYGFLVILCLILYYHEKNWSLLMSKMLYLINFMLAQRFFFLKCDMKLNTHISVHLTVLSGMTAKGWNHTFFVTNQNKNHMNCMLYDLAIFSKSIVLKVVLNLLLKGWKLFFLLVQIYTIGVQLACGCRHYTCVQKQCTRCPEPK